MTGDVQSRLSSGPVGSTDETVIHIAQQGGGDDMRSLVRALAQQAAREAFRAADTPDDRTPETGEPPQRLTRKAARR